MLPTSLTWILERIALSSAHSCAGEVLLSNKDATPVVAFVGFQKQGKSTLINAVLGSDLLPTDSLPATATVCHVFENPVAQASVLVDGSWREIPFESRAEYIDQTLIGRRTSPDAVRIGYPLPLLARMTILDTAGLGSTEFGHSDSSRSIFSDSDMLVIVCSLHRPLGRDDLEILTAARDGRVPIICVITKIDQADPDDADSEILKVATFVRSIFDLYGISPLGIFAVSARDDGNPESFAFGAISELREFLAINASKARINRVFSKYVARVGSNIADCHTTRASLHGMLEVERAAYASIHDQRAHLGEKAERSYEDLTHANEAFVKSFEEECSHFEPILRACIPAAGAVNDPDGIPRAWGRFRDAVPLQTELIRQRIVRFIRHEIEAANEAVSLDVGDLQALNEAIAALPKLRCDLPRAIPEDIARKPGFMAVSLGLHGKYVRDQFYELLQLSFDRAVETFGREFDRLADGLRGARIVAVNNQLELEGRRLDEAEAAVNERMAGIDQQLEDIADSLMHLEASLASAATDQVNHSALIDKLFVTVGDLRAEDVKFLAAAEPFAAALSGIVAYLDCEYVDAALSLANQYAVAEHFDRTVARLYWIACCRREDAVLYQNSEAVEMMTLRDPIGAAFCGRNVNVVGYTPVQRLVTAAVAGGELPSMESSTLDYGLLRDLAEVAFLRLDWRSASEVTSARLTALGAPSASVALQENIAERRRGSRTGESLAGFAQNHVEVLRSRETEIDLIARLQAYAEGRAPDPRRITSLEVYLERERWRAIAIVSV